MPTGLGQDEGVVDAVALEPVLLTLQVIHRIANLGAQFTQGDQAVTVGVDERRAGQTVEKAEVLGRIGPAAEEAIPALSKALRETEAHGYPFVHRSFCVGENAAVTCVQVYCHDRLSVDAHEKHTVVIQRHV